jgi:nucleoside-diphosphate-sugar epimerase
MLLLTGGTGFIGRMLLIQLENMGLEVRSLIRPSQRTPNLRRGVPHHAVLCSLMDLRGLRAALLGVDTVIHLASNERLGLRRYLPEVEIEGTRNLLQAALEAGIQRFIFISHIGVNLTSAYPVLRTKAMEEEYIRKSGVPYTILRPSLLYGAEDHFTTSIAKMLALAPFIFPLPGDGNTLIQPLGVEDFTTAICWTLDDLGTLGQSYDIGGPEFLTFRQVVQLVMDVVKIRRVMVDFRPPYLRAGAWLMERILREPPITTLWLDYLAVNRTTDLASMPRVFGLQPARMESGLDYLKDRSWLREFFFDQSRSG